MSARLIQPALYSFQSVDHRENKDWSYWSWTMLKDLASVLSLDPEVLWCRFFFANDRGKGERLRIVSVEGESWVVFLTGRVTQSDLEGGYDANSLNQPPFAFDSQKKFFQLLREGNFFVPMGWARQVIKYEDKPFLRNVGHKLTGDEQFAAFRAAGGNVPF